jgi:hypothetical protein
VNRAVVEAAPGRPGSVPSPPAALLALARDAGDARLRAAAAQRAAALAPTGPADGAGAGEAGGAGAGEAGGAERASAADGTAAGGTGPPGGERAPGGDDPDGPPPAPLPDEVADVVRAALRETPDAEQFADLAQLLATRDADWLARHGVPSRSPHARTAVARVATSMARAVSTQTPEAFRAYVSDLAAATRAAGDDDRMRRIADGLVDGLLDQLEAPVVAFGPTEAARIALDENLPMSPVRRALLQALAAAATVRAQPDDLVEPPERSVVWLERSHRAASGLGPADAHAVDEAVRRAVAVVAAAHLAHWDRRLPALHQLCETARLRSREVAPADAQALRLRVHHGRTWCVEALTRLHRLRRLVGSGIGDHAVAAGLAATEARLDALVSCLTAAG